MERYLSGNDVSVNIEVGLLASEVSLLTYRVIDESDSEVVAKTTLDKNIAMVDSEVIIVISGANNIASNAQGLRSVIVDVVTPTGAFSFETSYIIESSTPLKLGENSFVSYNRAQFVASNIPNLEGWANASRNERITAMIQAQINLKKLRYRLAYTTTGRVAVTSEWSIFEESQQTGPVSLNSFDVSRGPEQFKQALERAQIIEADFLLGGDPMNDMRSKGVVSKTTGESSQMFNMTKPVEFAVCKRAIREVGAWVDYGINLSR